MKKLLAPLLLIPGGLILIVGGFAVDLYMKITTGDSNVDALAPYVVAAVLAKLHPVTPAQWAHAVFVARALTAVANAEGSFGGAVGDQDASSAPGGPSISPWQIELVNAKAMGWVDSSTTREEYAAIVTTGPIASLRWALHATEFFEQNVTPYANEDLATALAVWNAGPRGTPESDPNYVAKSESLIQQWAAVAPADTTTTDDSSASEPS